MLRSVVWRLENGEAPDLSDLLEAARLACSFSYATAERIARAAVKAANSAAAVILLAEILILEGRVAEAERLFDGLVLDLLSGEDRQAVTYGRALCRTRLGAVSDVAAMITSASADHEVTALQLAGDVCASTITGWSYRRGNVGRTATLQRPVGRSGHSDARGKLPRCYSGTWSARRTTATG